MSLRIKPTGDWDEAEDRVNPRRNRRRIAAMMSVILEEVAEEIAEEARDFILAGRAEGPPLEPETIRRKGHATKLVDTQELAESITTRRVGLKHFVGIPKGARHSGGQMMTDIALAHEFGTATIPARKFLEPAAREVSPAVERRARLVLGQFWVNV